ncbi:Vesicle-associated protein 2-2, N-terminally processed like [Actinidia chinensis var. chinensis]|uniref:Vesicle-associated protein 2-2, N-terminally processed like n=1 Tax=Actinidia chinensis var. chinensis TaxID=1590841 RepID=A0A2R6RBJ0_ACTCC|nr:Vesicle-associated protein 2-2, N-terminally processed like [Actinidia chinensis var. chinensis]
MSAELLEIQPRELKFIFELKKQCSCSVRLVNKSNNHVAFKVKTTSPKKYCVRPNTGIVKPKSACDFTVTMQAQKLAPPDMICKDKFLVQCTVVRAGTTDEDINSSMFAKDNGRYIEENKLRVILISPPNSPILSPINGTLKHVPPYEASILKDQVLRQVERFTPRQTDTNDEESKMEKSEVAKPAKNVEYKTTKEVEEPAKTVKYTATQYMEELKFVKDNEEMKSKINELESKLSEAKVTISKLTEERRWTSQERESLRQELALLRTKRDARKVQAGFPFLFVCMVTLIGVIVGYLIRS